MVVESQVLVAGAGHPAPVLPESGVLYPKKATDLIRTADLGREIMDGQYGVYLHDRIGTPQYIPIVRRKVIALPRTGRQTSKTQE